MADTGIDQQGVWDDTDLLESWNEAFAEYKKYHSIAAKGGKISPPPSTEQNGFTNENNHMDATTTAQQPQDEGMDSDDYEPSLNLPSKSGKTASVGMNAAAAAMPQTLLANVQDDNTKNIMMSWYYAGYYTGLYEGKQQGYQSAMQQQQEA